MLKYSIRRKIITLFQFYIIVWLVLSVFVYIGLMIIKSAINTGFKNQIIRTLFRGFTYIIKTNILDEVYFKLEMYFNHFREKNLDSIKEYHNTISVLNQYYYLLNRYKSLVKMTDIKKKHMESFYGISLDIEPNDLLNIIQKIKEVDPFLEHNETTKIYFDNIYQKTFNDKDIKKQLNQLSTVVLSLETENKKYQKQKKDDKRLTVVSLIATFAFGFLSIVLTIALSSI